MATDSGGVLQEAEGRDIEGRHGVQECPSGGCGILAHRWGTALKLTMRDLTQDGFAVQIGCCSGAGLPAHDAFDNEVEA